MQALRERCTAGGCFGKKLGTELGKMSVQRHRGANMLCEGGGRTRLIRTQIAFLLGNNENFGQWSMEQLVNSYKCRPSRFFKDKEAIKDA